MGRKPHDDSRCGLQWVTLIGVGVLALVLTWYLFYYTLVHK